MTSKINSNFDFSDFNSKYILSLSFTILFRLEEMAEQDDPLGVFLSNGPVQEVGVNGLSSDEIRKQCQWLNKRKPRCGE